MEELESPHHPQAYKCLWFSTGLRGTLQWKERSSFCREGAPSPPPSEWSVKSPSASIYLEKWFLPFRYSFVSDAMSRPVFILRARRPLLPPHEMRQCRHSPHVCRQIWRIIFYGNAFYARNVCGIHCERRHGWRVRVRYGLVLGLGHQLCDAREL